MFGSQNIDDLKSRIADLEALNYVIRAIDWEVL